MVLRDGQCVGELNQTEIEYQRMVSMMMGRDVQQYYHHSRHDVHAGSVLEVRDLCYFAAHKPISFTMQEGYNPIIDGCVVAPMVIDLNTGDAYAVTCQAHDPAIELRSD